VDSRDKTSGDDFDYVVRFGNAFNNAPGVSEFDNVTRVDIKMASIPKVEGESYVILDITELRDSTLDATNNACNRAFAVAYFDTSLLAPGDTKPIKDFYTQRIEFNPPLGKLDRLSIRILKHDGSVVAASQTGNVTNTSMLFEIEMLK